MADLIPTAPGWYAHFEGDDDTDLIPVIAWATGTDPDGDDVLLPILADSPGIAPHALSASNFAEFNTTILYRPNHSTFRP